MSKESPAIYAGVSASEDDEKILSEMGYAQDLRRGFGGWFTSFAFCFTAVAVLPSITTGFQTSLGMGGPIEMVVTWIIVSIFTIIAGCIMGEICSSYPSAGSVYHWAGQLAPPKWAPILSFVTGWINFLGNLCGDAAYGWGFSNLLCGVLSDRYGTEVSLGGQVGIAIGVITLWAILNMLRSDYMGWVNNFAAFWQIASIFIIVIVILGMGNAEGGSGLAPSSFVWSEW